MGRILVAAFVATLIAAIAAVVGVPVLAQEPPAAPPPDAGMRAKLMAMDTDHDGRWSKAEWLAGGRKERGFDLMDTNHDGYLTIEELKAGRERMKVMREAMGKSAQ